MSIGLYVHGNSAIHRIPAGMKVVSLVGIGTLVFLVRDWRLLMPGLVAVILLYPLARIPWHAVAPQIRPALWLLTVILVVQALVTGWTTGIIIVSRFAILILLASLITATTRASDMIKSLEAGLRPLAHTGINPAKVSLALSLALRFIPVISEIVSEVRNAQRARGLDRSITAVAVPAIVKTLKMADDIADAIEARSYDSQADMPRASNRNSP